MVYYLLKIKAELENLTDLEPTGGCDDPNFTFVLKVKCGSCGEHSAKETWLTLNETVSHGRTQPHLIQKCKSCQREGNITMIPGRGMPLTQEAAEAGKFSPLMLFDCRGWEPVEFSFEGRWKAVSLEGTKFDDIDLSGGEFAEYDEKGACPVMISNVSASFEVVK